MIEFLPPQPLIAKWAARAAGDTMTTKGIRGIVSFFFTRKKKETKKKRLLANRNLKRFNHVTLFSFGSFLFFP
jgi:hypothetical protein